MKRGWFAGLLGMAMACGCARGGGADDKAPGVGREGAASGAVIATNVVPAGDKQAEAIKVKEAQSGTWNPGLSDAEKATLFAIAADTLEWCVAGKSKAFSFDKYTITDKLKVRMATFVTLKIGEDLRGCIGSLAPVAELYQSVHDNAVNAALHDYRFHPVKPPELPKLNVHISILSAITDIASLDEFKIGQHGIIIEKGMSRAVYLPEVAVEQGWTKEQTLSSLSMKAGMNPEAWRSGARFKIFSSVVLAIE